MTPEQAKVLEAALAWEVAVNKRPSTPEWESGAAAISLGEAVRAYRKSLEPKPRWTVREERGYFNVEDARHWIARCWSLEDAERIALLLNQEEK